MGLPWDPFIVIHTSRDAFTTMDDKRGSIIWLNAVFMTISTLAILARLLTRALLVRLVGPDDSL